MAYRIDDKPRTHCLECGDTITYGRKDKIFCCPRCKNKYNNRNVRRSRETKKKIQNILARNYEVLEGLIRLKIATIDLYDLDVMGFRHEYSTSYRKYGVRNEYHCYDIKYYMTDSRVFGVNRERIMLAEELVGRTSVPASQAELKSQPAKKTTQKKTSPKAADKKVSAEK